MLELETKIINRAKELLESGEVARVVGWKKGEFIYDISPATFENAEELKDFTYNWFSGANLSKYLIAESKKAGKTAVFLKPCDTYSFNQLIKEHRINVENVYPIAIECLGKLDAEKIKAKTDGFILDVLVNDGTVTVKTPYGDKVINKEEVLLTKCSTCEKDHVAGEEKIAVYGYQKTAKNRFAEVEQLENMSEDERFAFWRKQLSKCIRCNACRNVCPACSCIKCVFDNPQSSISAKANDDKFEEQLFHIIRAFHVSGRCTDCGECSRVCPQNIPLHLLNRKFIKDINSFYGEYQAGEDVGMRAPLVNYTVDDMEPGDAVMKGDA